jgi:ABC-type sugar transport system ATPase subunit
MNAKLIILDEPTAALSDREVEKLHQIVLKGFAKNKAGPHPTSLINQDAI